jgi:hypothetical protein
VPAWPTPDSFDDISAQELPEQASALVRTMAARAFDHQNELRTLLRLSLAHERASRTPRRGNTNRDTWIANLLEGPTEHVSQAARDRLAVALIPLFGADAVVWSIDIAQVDQDTAVDVMAWMAAVLVQATLDDAK